MAKKRVLVIGWDAADWKVITPLMDAGKMPALQKLVENGVMGNIATLDPPLSPILWTSIATGKWGDKHGILGFVEPDTANGFIRNVNSTSRKTRAIWNILHHEGYKCNVVGWWPSHPTEPINGVMISNFYQRANNKPGTDWKVPRGAVHPMSIVKELAPLRVHPSEITEQHILPFIPDAAKLDLKEDKTAVSVITALRKIICDTATIQSTATYLMENTEWDFMAVYYDGIDHFCHGFMKYHPPLMAGMPADVFNMYKHIVNGGYLFHDMMLERLLELAGDDTTVILLSDHGFNTDLSRIKNMPKLAAAPSLEHNPYGVFIMKGPGIKKDERVYGATLLDVTPTLLAALDLPVGNDMDGKVLASIFEQPVTINRIESWDKIEGDFADHPEHIKEDTYESVEALKQLIELGYVEDPGENKLDAMRKAAVENKYHLGKILMARKQIQQALTLYEELILEEPDDIRINLELASCYAQTSEFEKAREIVNKLKELSPDNENKRFLNIDLMEAKLLLVEGKTLQALDKLKSLQEKNPFNVNLLTKLGNIYFESNNNKDSMAAFELILRLDPNNANAYFGLALNQLQIGLNEDAAENALNAIGLLYHFPRAHFVLGRALMNLQMFEDAARAYELSLEMMPRLINARRWLIDIYENHIQQHEKAEKHKKIMEKILKEKITVVSGLPRSGTSMMMQMLSAGGMEVLSDYKREPDSNNPKGYYEYEKVKNLSRDNSWLNEAEGKVVKIISQLLQFLPAEYEYDVIFMDRDMDEILRSQQIMLGKDPNVYPSAIASAFAKDLQKIETWAKSQPGVRLRHVNYKDVIENPILIAHEINEFLNDRLDVEKMIDAVAPELYRNRS